MTLDLPRLHSIASAAAPGFAEPYRMHGYAAEVLDADDETVANCNTEGGRIRGGTPAEYAIALHIATFSPSTVLALLARIAELELDSRRDINALDGVALELARSIARIAELEAGLGRAADMLAGYVAHTPDSGFAEKVAALRALAEGKP